MTVIPSWFAQTPEGAAFLARTTAETTARRAALLKEVAEHRAARDAALPGAHAAVEKAQATLAKREEEMARAYEALAQAAGALREINRRCDAGVARAERALLDPGDPVTAAIGDLRARLEARLEDLRGTEPAWSDGGAVSLTGRKLGPFASSVPNLRAAVLGVSRAVQDLDTLGRTAKTTADVAAFERALLASLPDPQEMVPVPAE